MRAERVQKIITRLHMHAYKQEKQEGGSKTLNKGIAIGLRWAIREIERAVKADAQ